MGSFLILSTSSVSQSNTLLNTISELQFGHLVENGLSTSKIWNLRHFSHLYRHFLIIIAFHSPFYFKVYASKIYTSSIFPTVCNQLQIFRTIKDDVTGAAKSVTFFGKSFQDIKTSFSSIGNIKSSFSSLKEKLNVKKIFHTPTIDIEAIKEYNRLIQNNLRPEEALAEIRNQTNQATIKLIQSTDKLIETTQELERSSTLAG